MKSIRLLVPLVGLSGVLGVMAASQEPPKARERIRDTAELNAIRVDLELKDHSIRESLHALFAKVRVNHLLILEGASRGKITLGLRNVPFEGALVSILRSVQFTSLEYAGESGVLIVRPSRTVGSQGEPGNKRVWMDFEKVNVRQAIRALLASMGLNFVMEQGVQGTVSLVLDGVPYETAVDRMLKECKPPIEMWFEEGVYRFKVK